MKKVTMLIVSMLTLGVASPVLAEGLETYAEVTTNSEELNTENSTVESIEHSEYIESTIESTEISESSENIDSTEESTSVVEKKIETEEAVYESVFIDGEWIEILAEPEELSRNGDAESPYITEENQHALGSSMNNLNRTDSNSRSIPSNSTSIPRIDFVDVSSHQYEITVADFINMRNQGVTGVVVKLTESTSYTNPYAASQIKNAKAAGLKVSAYHYSWFVNKATAEAEARYFARAAQANGLDANTVMVNDAEQHQINNGRVTENSLYFSAVLKNEFGFKKVVHYSMASWFTPTIINMDKLGGNSCAWKAQFPNDPSKGNLLHSDASAWQWASDVTFVGDSKSKRLFDVNIDYSGTFSSKVATPITYINKRSFINKDYGAIYNEPYVAGTWKQDTTSGMLNQLIYITAEAQTSYGLWYQFSYTKSGVNKVGWIKAVDLDDVIDQKDNKQTKYVNKNYGAVYDSPYTESTKRIDIISDFKNNEFKITKEARTGYGFWYYGSYVKNGIVSSGWIKSDDLVSEIVKIETYVNKGIINKNYGAIYPIPHTAGVSSQDSIVGLQSQVVSITRKSQTSSGIWYESTYVKNGVTKIGWIKSVDIDFIINEKPNNKTMYLNKNNGAVYDSAYAAGTKRIDTTSDFKNNQFKITKEATTGYGLWYYGSYIKNDTKKTGWIKSVDLDTELVKIESYISNGIINKNYGVIYTAPYVAGVSSQDTIVGLHNQVVRLLKNHKLAVVYGINQRM